MKRLRDSGYLDNLSTCSSDLYPHLPPHQPSHAAQYFATIAATMGAMAVGSVTGYTSPAEVQLDKPTITTTPSTLTYTNTNTINSTSWLPLDSIQSSWFVASPFLGAAVGAVIGGVAINWVGRRTTMLASFPLFLINWVLVASAQNFWMLVSGRLVAGVSIGLTCTAVPTFIAECASPDIRGALGSTFQIMLAVGVVYPLALGTLVISWRWLAVLSAIPAIVHFGLVFFIKESPIFLMAK
ncbi:hypothetical protein Pcinc_027636 [Petrolisthes cinctipes]|uniref:Major facilitator superfamily (MFS) profile domain-containing protein n=1 Tax=Petrolisthes cinctipes TaxID=88211 RepID=A0AAE1KA12_PETCI|nr:hypothetical protein Pcinc_027636 [Petrolisthes cinctipes]